MIITSSQQLEDLTNPSNAINVEEFEQITMKFGAFVCLCKGKKMNYLNFLKFLIEDKKTQKIYFALLGEKNLHNIIRLYLSSTPNVYKKMFRSKYHKNERNIRV
jgi:hypothetical protein